MKSTKSLFLALCGTTAALTLSAAALRTLAFALSFDRSVGYFDAGLIPTLLYIVLALVPVAAVAYALLANCADDDQPLLAPELAARTPLIRIISAIVALAFAVAAVPDALALISHGLDWLVLARLLTALLAIPYFLLAPTSASAWSGVAAILHCIIMLATEYFDRYVTMNSPFKLMHQLAALAIMLYLLTELFALIGTPKPRRALPLAAIAAAYGITAGLSHLAATFMGDIVPQGYLMRAIVLLALGLYVAGRLASSARPDQHQDSEMEEI